MSTSQPGQWMWNLCSSRIQSAVAESLIDAIHRCRINYYSTEGSHSVSIPLPHPFPIVNQIIFFQIHCILDLDHSRVKKAFPHITFGSFTKKTFIALAVLQLGFFFATFLSKQPKSPPSELLTNSSILSISTPPSPIYLKFFHFWLILANPFCALSHALHIYPKMSDTEANAMLQQ